MYILNLINCYVDSLTMIPTLELKAILTDSRKGRGGCTPLYGLYRYEQPNGYGFSAVLVINRVSILADLGYFGHK